MQMPLCIFGRVLENMIDIGVSVSFRSVVYRMPVNPEIKLFLLFKAGDLIFQMCCQIANSVTPSLRIMIGSKENMKYEVIQ